MCNDRKTVISRDQICDGVNDCPATGYYLVAQDETHMCPGEILVFLHNVISFGLLRITQYTVVHREWGQLIHRFLKMHISVSGLRH